MPKDPQSDSSVKKPSFFHWPENWFIDVAIDLGTTKTLIASKDGKMEIQESSVAAINVKTGQILAIGNEAYLMLGKTPGHISAVRPLKGGVISDFEITEKMLKAFFNKLELQRGDNLGFLPFRRIRTVINIPCGGTEVEKKAVEDVGRNAGAHEVKLVESPIAIAIAAGVPVLEPGGNLVVNIGGGVTEAAVISLGGVVVFRSVRVAGDKLNSDIIQYVRDKFKMAIGEATAEEIKLAIGSAIETGTRQSMAIRGRDLTCGLPKEVKITDDDVRVAISGSLQTIIKNIKSTIESTPSELVADVMDKGIILAGGGSLLNGLDKLIAAETDLPVHLMEDPTSAVIKGMVRIINNRHNLSTVLIDINEEDSKINY
ncbi:MAG TPA: rod shape-determining protein [Candidatus Paceibacterota bacterium]|nr:rod shape-determining protein [Candidatus Paceibacterota bacterium]